MNYGSRILAVYKAAQLAEIVLVFLVAFVVIGVGWSLVGDDLFARQAVVWVANVLMMVTVWIGLRLRGQTWARRDSVPATDVMTH